MYKAIELLRDSKLLNDRIQGLGSLGSPVARKEIIGSICSIDLISDTLERISSLKRKNFDSILLPKLTVSGAGMIKIKLLSNDNGEIRYHVFPKSSLPELQKEVGGNCHIHDFQGFSHVLKGTIIEDGYNVETMSDEDKGVYNHFLHIVVNLDSSQKRVLFNTLEKVMNGEQATGEILPAEIQKFILNSNVTLKDISKWHHIYNGSKKLRGNGEMIEEFEDIGTYGFNYDGTRSIKAGERYFLPAERGHRVDTDGDTATFFVTDTTYQSQGAEKENGVFLRGHGKRFPWDQKTIEERSSSSYKLTNDELYKLVMETTNEVLSTL